MYLNGEPFDNSAGCVEGAVDYNATSPNFISAHNLFELEVRLSAFPGGCYSPEPAFWSATLPTVRATATAALAAADGEQDEQTLVSAAFFEVDPSTLITTLTPLALPPPSADLALTQTDSPDPVDAGATLAYRLGVSNAGPGTASSLVVTDTLPAGTTFQCASGSGACGASNGWACNQAAGVVTCTRPSLAVGAAPDIIILVTAPATAGSIHNTASVAAAEIDPNMADNSDAEDTFVAPVVPHDLAITKIVAPANVQLSSMHPTSTRMVGVHIQNRSPHSETVQDSTMLAKLVRLDVHSLGACPDPLPELVPGALPLTIPSKEEFAVLYSVSLSTACVNDPARGSGHEDYSYTAVVDHAALDGHADTHPQDDVCPRGPLSPSLFDPNPDGTIRDTGCGSKVGKARGGPVLTDVSARQRFPPPD